jgi:hypothetical protein
MDGLPKDVQAIPSVDDKGGRVGRLARRKTPGKRTRVGFGLGQADVLAARTLRTLATLEGHSLSLAQVVEPGVGAGGVVEEVLVAVAGQDKAEAFVADEPLDRAVHWCHSRISLKIHIDLIAL